MKRVINSAFLIVQYPGDNRFLDIWGNIWYSSANISNGWVAATKLPKEIQELNKQIKRTGKATRAGKDCSLNLNKPAIGYNCVN